MLGCKGGDPEIVLAHATSTLGMLAGMQVDAHIGIVLLLAIGDHRAIPVQLCSFAGVFDENRGATRYDSVTAICARDLGEITFA